MVECKKSHSNGVSLFLNVYWVIYLYSCREQKFQNLTSWLILLIILLSSAGIADPLSQEVPLDDKPYTTLIYANGPGYVAPRVNLTDAPLRM